jgi:hypothetical protein
MTVRDNPVKRIVTVQRIDGTLVVGVQGTLHVPIKLKLRSVSTQKTPVIFPGLRCRDGATSSVTSLAAA